MDGGVCSARQNRRGTVVSHTAPNEGGGNGGTTERPSAAFERAVVAYTHGNFALAVSHLRLLERDADAGHAVIDARHAALRGALAARAGNWTECCDWYIRTLVPSEAAGARSPEPTEPCHNDDCTSPVGNRCGQCSRWFCAAHGAESADEVSRCGPCLDVVVHNLVQAAILADRVEAAAEALTPWAGATNSATAQALLACIAPERAVGLGEQIAVLDAFVPDRRKALVLYRASTTLADMDLERVSVPIPGAPYSPFPELHEWLRPWKARGLSRAGRHTEAWQVRYEDWRARPVDTAAAHALAVEALRVFADGTETDDRTRLDAARQGMACWAMVLHSTTYWQELARRSENPWTSDERQTASDAVVERIRQALRDDDRAAERTVVDSLELAWDVELAAASGLAGAAATADSEWPFQASGDFSFGPGFLDLLRSAEAPWEALVEEIHGWVSDAGRSGGETGERLRDLMSPEGRYTMLLETGRFDQAIAALEAGTTVERRARGDAEPPQGPQRVLGAALVARAHDRVKSKRWSDAVRDFEDAAAAGASLTLHEEEIGRAGLQAGHALVRNRVRPDWQAYVGLLRRALALAPEDEELKRNLAVGCVHLGKHAQQQGDRDKARARFSQAYELDSSNETAVAALNEADTRWAEDLLEKQPSSELMRAIVALRRVLDRDAAFRPARKALATVLYERSLDVALSGARTEATGLMREARGLLEPGSDDWVPGWGPKEDIANGLCERAFPVDVFDEDDLRDTIDVIAVARTYEVLPGLADEQAALLAHLVGLLCQNGDYDEAIQLVRRCPRDAEDRSGLDRAIAEAYAGRARRRLDEGDITAAHSDVRAVCKYDPTHPLALFGPGESDQLW
ncbi:hypothetical protein OIE62_10455 [Streptomyces scopuliridis]|uniref:Uncharacterized protein n=1 Tax=Streptomyces scopuliridis TaxID=452529 RepID=A0ACD4ZSN2_9ACTN|nr:hypothetical protein [Streptomyces scopuliridis]WSC00984.1 hypothetical protein OG835_30940 [Streptomyces scopuliridis]WSC05406.1 hypothetical protein OIE62_10455 [Streptomyces scopuliridis]